MEICHNFVNKFEDKYTEDHFLHLFSKNVVLPTYLILFSVYKVGENTRKEAFMLRQIIKIDEAKCNGCGACASACHEGAIAMLNGKAHLLRDDYCDGLGNCLPVCPTGAITFEEREAAGYDEEAVKRHMEKRKMEQSEHKGHMCPGSMMRKFERKADENRKESMPSHFSALSTWPVQIKLVPVNAPYFNGAKLLIAADCTAYAYGSFHKDFMKGKVTIIGCPKLDSVDYSEKLTAIIKENDIQSVTIVRMEVPCCVGLEEAAKEAIKNSGKFIPWHVVVLSLEGEILEN